MQTYCLGTFPIWIARLIRWAIRCNSKSTVACTFRGRQPRRGQRYNGWGSLPIHKARAVSIYLKWDARRPVNIEHARIAAQQQARVDEYSKELQQRREVLQAGCKHKWCLAPHDPPFNEPEDWYCVKCHKHATRSEVTQDIITQP